jgi:hypothetical protein
MTDGGRMVGSVVIMLLLGAGPAWVASVRAAGRTELPHPLPGEHCSEACIEPAGSMRKRHPELLASWRAAAVRMGERLHRTPDGRQFPISLSGTCLGCHGSAAAFCDRCHMEVGVTLTCWQCHSPLAQDFR